jgi:putative methyltransferase (TIGR04325 family)
MGHLLLLQTLQYLKIAILDRMLPGQRIHYCGDYASWNEALSGCSGYEDAEILEKVRNATCAVLKGEAAFERDSVTFQESEYDWSLLALLFRQQSMMPGKVTVLDFGGALGSVYHQHRIWLNQIPGLRWCVVEQSHFVECGEKEFETAQLKFYRSVDECLKAEKVTFALFSCVLSYLADPWSPLTNVTQAGVPSVLINQTLVWDNRLCNNERVVVQHVPKAIYKATYPVRIFSSDQFVKAFTPRYRMGACWRGHEVPVVLCKPWQIARYGCFLFEEVKNECY